MNNKILMELIKEKEYWTMNDLIKKIDKNVQYIHDFQGDDLSQYFVLDGNFTPEELDALLVAAKIRRELCLS